MSSKTREEELSLDEGITEEKKLPWQIKVFLFTLIVPVESSFQISALRLTPNRIFLLLLFFPCFKAVFSGHVGPRVKTDWLILLFVFWVILALISNHGLATGLESGGIFLLESLGAYLIGRSLIISEDNFRKFTRTLILIIIGLLIFTIPEALTGYNYLRPSAGHSDQRFGLYRAVGPFEHAILYGVFSASAFSLSFFHSKNDPAQKSWRLLKTGCIGLATFLSVSSGPLIALLTQFALIIWAKFTKGSSASWKLLGFFIIILYFAIDLVSDRNPIRAIITKITFSSHTAYTRLIIWEWGLRENVLEHPWLGIGFSEWVRPEWLSSSVDNFWLVTMMRYGLPAFFFLAFGIVSLIVSASNNSALPNSTANPFLNGWRISMLGLIVAASTVHFWNSLFVWFFFLLGSGAYMAQQPHNIETRPTTTRRF